MIKLLSNRNAIQLQGILPSRQPRRFQVISFRIDKVNTPSNTERGARGYF
jgi:hypothetical protein